MSKQTQTDVHAVSAFGETPMVLHDVVAERLASAHVLPELAQQLLAFAERDDIWVRSEWRWGWLIPALGRAFCVPSADVKPFAAAWGVMYAAIVRLDHLQDGDQLPVGDLPEQSVVTNNGLLSYYVLAHSLLDCLSLDAFTPERLLRIYRLWNTLTLRMASGQHRDLLSSFHTYPHSLDSYQELVFAKTGATFALAFGGVAALQSDDAALIDVATEIGALFGALVQYSDDITDADTQPNPALTLPRSLVTIEELEQAINPQAFWMYLHDQYLHHVTLLSEKLPPEIAVQLLTIFRIAFGDTAHSAEVF